MTLIVEVSNPVQWRPWRFRSRIMSRFGWLWFALAVIHISLHDLVTTEYDWVTRERQGR